MSTEPTKKETPPYIAFSTFLSFIKGLAKDGIPSRIDKSLLRSMSGSNQSALLAALRWFGLIDEAGNHGQRLEELVAAGDEMAPLLRKLIVESYAFLSDNSIELERATGSQLEEKFRAYGLSGATIIKAMAFFLTACKEAGIIVSNHVKLPKVVRSNGSGRSKKAKATTSTEELPEEEDDELSGYGLGDPGVMKFEIPIPINRKVKISIPSDFSDADWTLLQTMFNAYVTHWKSMKREGENQ